MGIYANVNTIVKSYCRCGAAIVLDMRHYAGVPELNQKVQCAYGHDTLIRVVIS